MTSARTATLLTLPVALALSVIVVPLATAGSDEALQAADASLRALLSTVLLATTTIALWPMRRDLASLSVRRGHDRRVELGKGWLVHWALLTTAMLTVCAGALIHARTLSDPDLGRDLLRTLPVVVAAVTSVLAFALSLRLWLGKAGLVAGALLAFVLAQQNAIVSAVLPVGHINHLLGVGQPLPFDQGWSMAALYAMALLFAALAVLRVPR